MKSKILYIYYKFLALLAKRYLKRHKPCVIGINGSVGKTSCRMIIYQTIQQLLPHISVYTSSKNFNGELGLSLSIFQIESFYPSISCFLKTLFKALWKSFFGQKKYDVIVLEYGIDRPKEMEFLIKIIKPNIGVFTAIDAVHSEQFGSPVAIANEEIKMIKNTLETAFLNEHDIYAMQLRDHIKIESFVYQTEGYESKGDIHFDNEKFFLDHEKATNFGVEFDLGIKGKKYHIKTNIFGKAHYGYIGVAITIAQILDYKYQKSGHIDNQKEMNLNFTLQPGRFSVFEGIENSIIFDSSYNSAPLSVRNTVNAVINIKRELFPERSIWLVLGDMRELGDLTEKEHRLLAGYVSQTADRVFLVGKYMTSHLYDELDKIGYDMTNVYKFDKSVEAGIIIKKMLIEKGGDVLIVFKGSQNTIFLEEAVKLLLKNSEDEALLTRQSKRRLKTKNKFLLG